MTCCCKYIAIDLSEVDFSSPPLLVGLTMSHGTDPTALFVKERIILWPRDPTQPTVRGPWGQLGDQTQLTGRAVKVWRREAFTPSGTWRRAAGLTEDPEISEFTLNIIFYSSTILVNIYPCICIWFL